MSFLYLKKLKNKLDQLYNTIAGYIIQVIATIETFVMREAQFFIGRYPRRNSCLG